MNQSSEAGFFRVISGRQRGVAASACRAGLRVAEPFYAIGVRVRNWTFDAHFRPTHSAPRPVICVGNITTGGTGKTPVVRWLADELRRRGQRPAVLLRGYKGDRSAGGSDEQRLLEELLRDDSLPRVPVVANPDRMAGARGAIEIDPQLTCFLLDDGFQHRRLRRQVDLVLIDCTNPFGYSHLLPRGLLREPLGSLRRAHALLLTHTEAVAGDEIPRIEAELRRHNPFAPIYHSRHVHKGFLTHDDDPQATDLHGRRYLAFCGIGNPNTFVRQLESTGGQCVATRVFGDHHAYDESDLNALERLAAANGADVMMTTQKDWVKLRALPRSIATKVPIWRAELAVEFSHDHGQRLLEQILARIDSGASS